MALNAVTLTATPASAANSIENTGRRIDGYDNAVQPIPVGFLTPSVGWIRVRIRPRHTAAGLVLFGNTGPTILEAWGDATNYIRVYGTAANNIRLEFNDGGGVHQANWNCTGLIVADTEYLLEVLYAGSVMWLIIDHVQVATITQPIVFVTTPTNVYWGSQQALDEQADIVYVNP